MSTDSYGYDTEPAKTSGFEPEPSRSRAGARSQASERSRPKAPPRRRRKARRVHRVVRHIDIWSLAKIGAVYVACGYVVSLISGFILWRAADIAGTIDGIEGFMEDTGGYDTFDMRGDVVFSSAVLIGAVLSVLAVCLIILAGILFNLISDLTGGIRMTVIDEDLLVTPARRGARPRRSEVPPVHEPPADADRPWSEPEREPSEPEPEPSEPEPEPSEPASATEQTPAVEPEATEPSRSWVEPDPEPAPTAATAPTAEPVDVPTEPVDPEPVGGVDPAFDRLVAGDADEAPAAEPSSYSSWPASSNDATPQPAPAPEQPADTDPMAEPRPETPQKSESAPSSDQPLFGGWIDGSDERSGEDEPDTTPTDGDGDESERDEPKPRFEIDFG